MHGISEGIDGTEMRNVAEGDRRSSNSGGADVDQVPDAAEVLARKGQGQGI